MNKTKKCNICKKVKPLDEFYRHCRGKDGVATRCKACKNEYSRRRCKTLVGHLVLRKRHLKAKFGITLEKYERMFEEQDGLCAICGQPEIIFHPQGTPWLLSVDHSHETGQVRALLCNACNQGIGWFERDMDMSLKFIEYLEKHAKE